MNLVLLLDATQNRNRVLDRRLVDHDRLETTRERGVLFDVLAILVESRRADGVQLAACQRRFEHVARVQAAVTGARPDNRMQLVDEQDDVSVALLDFAQHCLQAVLEFTAVLCARDHRT